MGPLNVHMRRGIDRSGKTRHHLRYVKYVNPLYPLQRGKAPNTRDQLQECSKAFARAIVNSTPWRMNGFLSRRFGNIQEQMDRASRWLAREYNGRI
jgi:hypothetical protein